MVLDVVRTRSISPTVALVIAVLGVSSSAILVRWSTAPSVVVAFYRVLFTLAVVAPIAWYRHREEFAAISRRDGLAATGAGVALAGHFAAWFESLAWTSIAASVTLVQTQPIFVAIGAAVLLSERVGRRTVVGICVAVVGAGLMTVLDHGDAVPVGGDAMIGNALALTGAVLAAAYILAGRSLRQRVSVFPYVTVVYATCAATLLVATIASGEPLVAYPPTEWVLFVAMALGPGLLGHTVVNWALAHLPSTLVSVSLLGEPVGATVLGALLLDELPASTTVVAGVVVLAGIYLTATARNR